MVRAARFRLTKTPPRDHDALSFTTLKQRGHETSRGAVPERVRAGRDVKLVCEVDKLDSGRVPEEGLLALHAHTWAREKLPCSAAVPLCARLTIGLGAEAGSSQ